MPVGWSAQVVLLAVAVIWLTVMVRLWRRRRWDAWIAGAVAVVAVATAVGVRFGL